ncbi:hypothetical protein IVB69_01950 [Flavobacterium sp. J49]|uniref:hypothetical protein n=1 Tax=Flavobacterium sp. J49 TaxID=2718534 RepID=UPI001594A1E0|nr:hypothetical protein [Flavobacterium sp. J49]MBF6640234.1 hypothetical protein [Flavobacterium sp. J49]NIC01479.1 hypothetical protein [Flavobacterium sp. J49]
MRNLALIVILVFAGCQSRKGSDFIFYKWNIQESYYLKFNSTDTLYLINPYEEQTSYTILKSDEKEKIQSVLDSISFPQEKTSFSRSVNDGVTYAFNLKKNNQSSKLKIHADAGPNQFWVFGKSLEEIKNNHKFIKIKKVFDLSEIDSMVFQKVKFVKKNNGH